MCRELIANGVEEPKYHTDDFILKITVPKLTETEQKPNRNRIETEQKPNRNRTENRNTMLQLMKDDPYISKAEIANILGLHPSAVSRMINSMRGKYLRRVGPDKGGFWEVLMD